MFTGIILAVGHIAAVEQVSGDYRLKIATASLPLDDVKLGDSIAVNGVCLTAVELGVQYFCADVSNETWSRTTLASAHSGALVNLELALMPSSRLGGHFVSGHVDGVGTIIKQDSDGRSIRFIIQAPDALAKYIAEKGSICIDGISLTVNEVKGAHFGVNIVPHTLHETALKSLGLGASVNLEVDLLARYLERLLTNAAPDVEKSHVTHELLHTSGFLN
ncbi:MAG: riboflavin synthase [Methylovulum sp.]|jgi:riboflavin synthase